MTNNKKAFQEAEKELQKDRINEIKEVMKSLLQKIQEEKEKKAAAEEALRLLKLDMDDLRNGKIDKIKDRHEKSKKASQVSPLTETDLNKFMSYSQNAMYCNAVANNAGIASGGTGVIAGIGMNMNWGDATSGTYQVNCANGQIKELNL